jgi:hypothetical protein
VVPTPPVVNPLAGVELCRAYVLPLTEKALGYANVKLVFGPAERAALGPGLTNATAGVTGKPTGFVKLVLTLTVTPLGRPDVAKSTTGGVP